MLQLEILPVSRVRENRTHGLKGVPDSPWPFVVAAE
jgi:hypothetical protein